MIYLSVCHTARSVLLAMNELCRKETEEMFTVSNIQCFRIQHVDVLFEK